jgi:hypothetical protein
MYSYEDRIRAVKLFIKLGTRNEATIRQLGYPTKNSLKSWYLEYQRHHDLPIGYVRSRPMYLHEQKVRAVDHYLTHGLLCCNAQSAGLFRKIFIPTPIHTAAFKLNLLHSASVTSRSRCAVSIRMRSDCDCAGFAALSTESLPQFRHFIDAENHAALAGAGVEIRAA